VSDVLKSLLEIPEYKEAAKRGFGPTLFTGAEDNHCGRIAFTEITGGTDGSPKIYEKMANAGIGTIISMHQSEEHKKEAEKAHINVVIAGHISSDSIGMNLFLDQLEKKGIEIVSCSGLIRISRAKK
jgi:putative NIF3 family GTP cyclohydrolase 1 type 2